jgi:hypothetical protein
MKNDLLELLDDEIHNVSEMSDEDLGLFLKKIERSYVHVLIEQSLRVNKVSNVTGVSRIGTRPRSV